MRTSATTVVLGLGRRRESLRRLREDPHVALCVMADTDLAFTLDGTATVVEEDAGGVAAVRIDVHAVHDHMTDDFTVESPVGWRWTNERAAARDDEVRSTLRRVGA